MKVLRNVSQLCCLTVISIFQESLLDARLEKSDNAALRKPLPGPNKDSASKILVFPAPLSPTNTTNCERNSNNSVRYERKFLQENVVIA